VGSEIDETRFSREDFHRFGQRLKEETETLKRWLQSDFMVDEPPRMGLELETWLVDRAGRPAPVNAHVLRNLQDPLLTPELAQYNLELNTDPRPLAGRPFSATGEQLTALWDRVAAAAGAVDCQSAMIGILPSLRESDLCLERMSGLKRYEALNEQILQLRNRRPIEVDIEGVEHVRLLHDDLMLEAAATSIQLHLQVAPRHAARLYNASVVASAASVAPAADLVTVEQCGHWVSRERPEAFVSQLKAWLD
jgi:pimeloyl-ACP methyl ester carboxylesterase